DQDTIVTNGDIEIDIINKVFDTEIPDGDDYATLSGLLHERLQDIPQEGDKVEVDELRIVVEKVSKNIPKKIRIEKIRN
ncbi:MAG: hemolysin, partial [Nitrosopumilus sp. (ex Thoosa mismalolli)]|nr:hemolysin [Nitrosopumilus sp. (ex Thoosa mismalolli)]